MEWFLSYGDLGVKGGGGGERRAGTKGVEQGRDAFFPVTSLPFSSIFFFHVICTRTSLFFVSLSVFCFFSGLTA